MKKLVFLGFILFTFKANSQIINNVYLSSGISVSSIDLNTIGITQYDKSLVGFTSNVRADYLGQSHWSLHSKFGFTQIGGRDKTTWVDASGYKIEDVTSRYYFNYLNFSTAFKYKCSWGKFDPFMLIGPRIDYLLSSTVSSKSYEDFNVGGDMGCGLAWHVDDHLMLLLNLEYGIRFNDIMDGIKPNGSTSIEIGLGYKIK